MNANSTKNGVPLKVGRRLDYLIRNIESGNIPTERAVIVIVERGKYRIV